MTVCPSPQAYVIDIKWYLIIMTCEKNDMFLITYTVPLTSGDALWLITLKILSIKQFETHLINILNTSYICEENLLECFENVIKNAKMGVLSIHVFKVQKKKIHEL